MANIGVNIWDVTSGKRKTSLRGCPGWIGSISWSPDGKYLAAGNDRSTVVIWEIASGNRLRSLHGHAAPVLSVDWNPDGVRLAAGGDDGTIRIWNAHTAKMIHGAGCAERARAESGLASGRQTPPRNLRQVRWLQRGEDLEYHEWPRNRWMVDRFRGTVRSSARMELASHTMTVRSALGT